MAEFQAAFDKTMGTEGGIQFNPADRGNTKTMGTYRGIAPSFWPHWRGWAMIERHIKSMVSMPAHGTREHDNWRRYLNGLLAADSALQRLVRQFYFENFWQPHRLGELNSQPVADWLFDHIVNGGCRGVQWVQEALGIDADGIIGQRTVAAINQADPDQILERAEDIAAIYRLDKCRLSPSQIQFLPSWLRRDGCGNEEIQAVMAAARDGRLDDAEVARLTAMITGQT